MSRLTALALSVVVLAPLGCKATGLEQAQSTVADLHELQSQLKTGKGAINQVTKSVDQLATAQAGSLNRFYDNFRKAVAKVEAQALRVRSVREKMESQKNSFVNSWNDALKMIQDDELRLKATKRRDDMLAKFTAFEEFRKPTSDTFEGWFQQITDVKKTLEFNLSPDGLNTLSEDFDTIKSQANDINTSIDELIDRLGSLAGLLEAAYPEPTI